MALLGMLAAGAGIGAARAAEKQHDYDNMMRVEMDREALRQQFLERKVMAKASADAENARIKSWLEQRKYEQTKADKEAEYDKKRKDSLSDAEIAHKRSLEKENLRQSRMDSRVNKKALLDNSISKSQKGITLSDGSFYVPMSPQGRLAVDLINAKNDPRFADALYAAEAKGLTSQVAGSIQGITDGTVPAAKEMVRQLYGQDAKKEEVGMNVARDPKTGKLYIK